MAEGIDKKRAKEFAKLKGQGWKTPRELAKEGYHGTGRGKRLGRAIADYPTTLVSAITRAVRHPYTFAGPEAGKVLPDEPADREERARTGLPDYGYRADVKKLVERHFFRSFGDSLSELRVDDERSLLSPAAVAVLEHEGLIAKRERTRGRRWASDDLKDGGRGGRER